MNSLSVIVITRNRLEKLKRCLDSVKKVLLSASLIVVDNGSTDGTEEYLKSLRGIENIRLESNAGVAKARNIGIRKAQGKYIMFLDDDAWIDELDIKAIMDFFAQHPDTGMIAPRILYPDGRIQESVRAFPTMRAIIWRGSGLYKLMPNASFYKRYISFDGESIHQIDWAIGACQVIRRAVFDDIGLLDEHYHFGYEDADMCRRLKKSRYKVIYWPNAAIYHEYSRESAEIFSAHFFSHSYSVIRFFFSHGI
jgi:GT2 family glycosyltransferase